MAFECNFFEENSLIDENRLRIIINALDNSPLGKLNIMDATFGYDFVPLEMDTLIAALMQEDDDGFAVGVRMGSRAPIEFSSNVVRKENCAAELRTAKESLLFIDAKSFIPYINSWRDIMKGSWGAAASCDDRESSFWIDETDTDALPDCFGLRLGWYHLMSPEFYQPYFKREDLLATPALRVEEFEDGAIGILCYEHPHDYSKPETTKDIIKITNYLNSKDFDKGSDRIILR